MTGAWSYKTFALCGLIATIWFAALAKGAHDLWAATVLFAFISLTTLALLADFYKQSSRMAVPFLTTLAVMMGTFLLASGSSYDLNTTRLELWIWLFSSLAFFLFLNIFRDPGHRFRFLTFGGLVILPLTLMAAAQYGRDLSAFYPSHWAAKATFTNSAVLAGFALTWTIIFWHLREKASVYRWLFVGCVLTLLMARSWWAYISLLFGFMFYYKERIKSSLNPIRLETIITGFAVFIFLILVFLYKLGYWQASPYRAMDRWDWWMAGLRMIKEHPWTGVGLGSYGTAFPFFKSQGILNTLYAHSFPIQLLSETGLVGLIGSLFLGITYVQKLSKQKNITREMRAYRATVLTIVLYSLTTIYLDYFIGKLMLWMAIALTLSSFQWKDFAISRQTLCLGVGTLLLLAPSWYLPFRASQCYIDGLRYVEAGDSALAELAFRKGIELNPYQDESYAALAGMHRTAYQRSRSGADLAQWKRFIQQAYEKKKDIRYALDLAHPPDKK